MPERVSLIPACTYRTTTHDGLHIFKHAVCCRPACRFCTPVPTDMSLL